jgi:hypothetical protein
LLVVAVAVAALQPLTKELVVAVEQVVSEKLPKSSLLLTPLIPSLWVLVVLEEIALLEHKAQTEATQPLIRQRLLVAVAVEQRQTIKLV